MFNIIARMFGSNTGVTTVEYALIAALIAVAMTAGIGLVSPSMFATFKAASETAPVD